MTNFFTYETKDVRGNTRTYPRVGRIIGTVLGSIFALTLVLGSYSTVGPGERGVLVTFGKASDGVLEPGLHLKLPLFSTIKTISVQVNKSDVETSAASKDMQEIHTHVAVNWSVNATSVVNTYKNIGDEDQILKRIIAPAVSEVLKAEMAKLTAEEILTKRLDLKKAIDNGLTGRLANYGVSLADLSIVNLTFSQQFTKAIEDKQIAEQQAKQAEYVAQKATADAKASVNTAKGEAEATVIQAKAQAEANLAKAKAQSEAQKLLRQTITPELLQLKAIERWDGTMPNVLGSSQQSGLLFNIPVTNKSTSTTTTQEEAKEETNE